MDERTRRIGENEAIFREVNDRVNDLNERFEPVTESFVIVCECGDPSCMARITLTADEYRDLRADAAQFAVVPGHEAADVETVVEHRDGYDLIRKRPGAPRRLAEQTR